MQGIERFAFSWLVIDTLQAGDIYLGLAAFTLGIPVFFFSLPAGVLADRWNRRILLIVSQVVVLAGALLAAILIWMDLMTLRVALGMALFVGTGIAIGQPVRQALIPAVVPAPRLMNAITLNTAGQTVSQMLGPGLGGIAIWVAGLEGNFALQAILMGAGLLFLIPLRIPARALDAGHGGGIGTARHGRRPRRGIPLHREQRQHAFALHPAAGHLARDSTAPG